MVIVNSLHVVAQVPLARETAARNRSLTAFMHAEERLVAVAMKTMSFTLVAKKAGSRGKSGALASFSLASIGLQVGVNKLAVQGVVG